jgi:hypothetical protein
VEVATARKEAAEDDIFGDVGTDWEVSVKWNRRTRPNFYRNPCDESASHFDYKSTEIKS